MSKLFPFPKNDVPAEEKRSEEWLLKLAQAFWYDTGRYGGNVLASNRANYDLYRQYGMGNQLETLYHKWMGVDPKTNQTFHNISYKIIPFITHLRDILIKKVMDVGFNVIATPIDPSGGRAANNKYADLKAKLLMRKQFAQAAAQNPELQGLLDHPALSLGSKDPQDLDELEWRLELGEQFNRSMNAEQVIALCMHQNGINAVRKEWATDLVDWGMTAVIDDLDENDNPIFYRADIRHIVTNRFLKEDGADITRWGYVMDVSKASLVAKGIDRMKLEAANTSQYGNKINGISADSDFVKVLFFEHLCTDEKVYDIGTYKGNPFVSKAKFEKRNNKNYTTKKQQNIYTCKWVIGTDIVYDNRLKYDMKRSASRSRRAATSLSLHLIAYNFHEMSAKGFMERVLPLIDEYQRTYLRLQAFKSKMIPNGFMIDINALESLVLENPNTGANMTVLELLDMFTQTGIGLFEGKDLGGATGNYTPIRQVQNSSAQELVTLYNELVNIKNSIKEMWGLNEATDATSISDRSNSLNINSQIQNTNNSLWPLLNAQKSLIETLSEEMYKRVQQSIRRRGSYEGWMPALNSNVPMFIKSDEDMDLMDAGIVVEILPTNEERQLIIGRIQQYIIAGLLPPGIEFKIMGYSNLKMMEGAINHEVKKWDEKKQQNALQQQQQNGQIQQQSAMVAGEENRKTIQADVEGKAQLLQLEYSLKKDLEMSIIQGKAGLQTGINQAKTMSSAIQADGKIDAIRVGKGLPAESQERQPLPEQLPETLMPEPEEEMV